MGKRYKAKSIIFTESIIVCCLSSRSAGVTIWTKRFDQVTLLFVHLFAMWLLLRQHDPWMSRPMVCPGDLVEGGHGGW